MLGKHAKLWSGDIGGISNTVHRIEHILGARTVRQMLYRPGPTVRQVEEEEVDRIFKAGGIKPSDSEWALSINLAPKPTISYISASSTVVQMRSATKITTRLFVWMGALTRWVTRASSPR